MACAHAKFTGEVGVCLATSGPGRDPSAQRPVRRQARPSAGRRDRRPAGAHRAGRQLPAGSRSRLAVQGRRARVRADGDDPAQMRHLVDRAFRIARAERTVTCLIVPNDCRRRSGARRAARARHGALGGRATATRASCPATTICAARRTILNAGERVAILVGAGALDADRRGHRGRRTARRGRRQGAARQGRRARRPAVRHRLDRPARHEARAGT